MTKQRTLVGRTVRLTDGKLIAKALDVSLYDVRMATTAGAHTQYQRVVGQHLIQHEPLQGRHLHRLSAVRRALAHVGFVTFCGGGIGGACEPKAVETAKRTTNAVATA